VKLPSLFSDHLVLQRSEHAPVWGWASPGEEITVTLGDASSRTTTGANGRWQVELDLSRSPEGPFELVISGTGTFTVRDVLVGEVWLASGQSNMELTLKDSIGAEGEMALPENLLLREFRVEPCASPKPLSDCTGRWMIAGPKTVGDFSATAYHFAKHLQRELHAPVAVIHSSWGATPVEAWTSWPSLETVPPLAANARRHIEEARDFPEAQKRHLAGSGPKPPREPWPPRKFGAHNFNGMIAPLLPCAMRGVIWYQGEGNASRAFMYRTAFPLLIDDWRRHWGRGNFPFYFCQLTNYQEKSALPGESEIAELREAQHLTLRLPNTGEAVLIDIGESKDIHPRNKKDAGERLARIALARDYGRDVPYSGPVYDSMQVEGNKIRLRFQHADGGLVAAPLPAFYNVETLRHLTAPLVRNSPKSQLEGFAICGADHKWAWADAKIDGDVVMVWSDAVPAPVAVRYGWADNPTCNLENGAGLPASPFRTDDFPGVTRDVVDW